MLTFDRPSRSRSLRLRKNSFAGSSQKFYRKFLALCDSCGTLLVIFFSQNPQLVKKSKVSERSFSMNRVNLNYIQLGNNKFSKCLTGLSHFLMDAGENVLQ